MSESKPKFRKAAWYSVAFALILVGVGLGVFTCCTDPSTVPSDLSSMQWNSKLENGVFVLSDAKPATDLTKLQTTGSSGEYLVTLFKGNDHVDGTMKIDGSDGELTVDLDKDVKEEKIAVRLSDKQYLLRLTIAEGIVDFIYSTSGIAK